MRRIKIKFLTILLCLVSILICTEVNIAEIYGDISGKVIDKATNKGIEDAFVFIKGDLKLNSRTDVNGNYIINNLLPGNYTLVVNSPLKLENSYKPENRTIEVTLEYGKNLTKVNFYIKKMGSISGKLYEADGLTPYVTTPSSGFIYAYNSTDQVYSDKRMFYERIYNTTSDFLIIMLPNSENWQLFYVNMQKDSSIVYKYKEPLELNEGVDIKDTKFVLSSIDSTKIFGKIKDKNGNNIKIESGSLSFYPKYNNKWFEIKCLINEDGTYLMQGDIPEGIYTTEVIVNEIDSTTSPGLRIIKAINRFNTGEISIDKNEQKEIDFIFDNVMSERKIVPNLD